MTEADRMKKMEDAIRALTMEVKGVRSILDMIYARQNAILEAATTAGSAGEVIMHMLGSSQRVEIPDDIARILYPDRSTDPDQDS